MNKIFIESKKEQTAECNFLKAILAKFFPDKAVQFVCMNGVGNLFNETNRNQMNQAIVDGDQVIVILDADTKEKGFGFEARLQEVNNKKKQHNMEFPLFLYPNHADDGDVETLMEWLAQKELHGSWWDCFEDYEKCVSCAKDDNGSPRYLMPNRKAKLHTYISSQKLSNAKRDKLGAGNWLFEDTMYWDLNRTALLPLIDFLRTNLN